MRRAPIRPWAALLLLLAALAASPASPAGPASSASSSSTALSASPALRLAAGSVARRQVVAIGRDVTIEGEAMAGVTALDGTARISGSVASDVTVLGGDVELAPTARVAGDVFVLGGELRAAAGARVEGRAVAYPTISRASLTLLEGPGIGLSAASPTVVAAKLALVTAWLALTLLLFAVSGRSVAATSDEIRREPLRCFAAGVVAVLALTLTTLFLSALLPAVASMPLVALAVVAALVAKLWGTVAVFHAVGARLATARSRGRRRTLALHAAVAGLALFALVKLVPYLGLWVWWAATFVGVGAALRTKFGRFEPWFDDSPAPSAGRA
jgi:hypothetical protein